MFARARNQGVSVIEILRGAPKVHDGVSRAFTKPTVMNFQFYVSALLYASGVSSRTSTQTLMPYSGLVMTWFAFSRL